MGKKFELKFKEKKKIAIDTFSFYFDKENLKIDFKPGEYIRMSLDIKNSDNRGSSRYFTIASSPLDKYIIITTKVIKSSFKKELLNLKPGKIVKFFGPMGNFILDKNDFRTQVFLAGGIGITTFYSMLKYADQGGDKKKTYLLASFSIPEEIIYKDELNEISKRNKNFSILYTVSSKTSVWSGETGRIDEEKIKKYVPDYSSALYFVVGPPKMVEDIKNILINLNISSDNINLEDFSGY